MMSAVPLAVIDASICWWVFSALIQTTRALRLRRNLVKLSVYKVVLIFFKLKGLHTQFQVTFYFNNLL